MRKSDRELGMTQAEIDLVPAVKGNLMFNIETGQYHYHDGVKYLLLSSKEIRKMMDTPINIEMDKDLPYNAERLEETLDKLKYKADSLAILFDETYKTVTELQEKVAVLEKRLKRKDRRVRTGVSELLDPQHSMPDYQIF